MSRRKWNYYTAGGLLALALGLTLRQWMHGNATNFLSGFLLGVAIALMIGGLAKQSRGTSN